MIKYVMGLLVCVCVMASPVLAGGGGGGAKKDANIKIVHDLAAGVLTGLGAGNDSFIVIADAPAALINKVNAGTAVPKDITAAGGIIVKVGRSAVLPVKSGNVRLYGAVVLPGGLVEPVTNVLIPVAKGQTVTVKASTAPVNVGANWPLP